ncbi:MAG: hypothetical protein ABJO09_10325 [Hyphomicrobiales bacterium]
MLLDETFPLQTRVEQQAARSLTDRIEEVYDQAISLDMPRFKLAGLARKPSDMVNFLRSHGARARRHTMPKKKLVLDCYGPNGGPAVEITFGDA